MEPGTRLGPYLLGPALGSGGMGVVHRAEGPSGPVALKLVHANLLATPGIEERFLREGEIGRRVRHENVVATLDVGAAEHDGVLHRFLVMEYVLGQTLRALLTELDRVPEELCRHVGIEVAKGLAAMHAAGVVHRDVKPENVLITDDHVVKVMDLGVARLVDESVRLSQSGAFVGSILYAAPEQFGRLAPRGAESGAIGAKGVDAVDGRADLHALGVVLYELSTGTHPYQADDFRSVMRRVLDEKPRRPGEINPQLSPFFEEVVLTLLAKDREQRFPSAAELARVLGEGESSAWWTRRAEAIRSESRRPLRRIRIPRETSLYGRERELALLRAAFDRATEGDGQVVLVEGEAGIGKSRLVDEFVSLLHREGHDVSFLFGGHPPGGAATASGAFSTAWREHFGDASLETALAAHLAESPLLVAPFAALLRGEPPPQGTVPLTKDSLQTAFVRTTQSLSRERVTIVVIDDLHFAPDEGRSLFAALAHAVPGHRLLLVGTSRPPLEETWATNLTRLPHAARLAVGRLGPRDLAALLKDALKSARLAEELALKIAEKTDGNPYFVFEILRELRDGRFLTQRADGTWATTKVIREIAVPSTVKDLIDARVAELAEKDRELLHVAACCGFEFDPLLVGEALGIDRFALLRRLGTIEKTHRLVRSVGRRYVFDHHQVQEVLYEGLSDLHRESYHAAIAATIESREGATAREPASLDGALSSAIAEHYLRSAEPARSLRYLGPALTYLEKAYRNDAAARLASRALGVEGLLAGRERCGVLIRLASRFELVGRRAEERPVLDEAIALADAAGDAEARIEARTLLGWLLHCTSRGEEAERAYLEAIALARDAGDLHQEGVASGNLGLSYRSRGRLDDALRCGERYLAIALERGDLRGEALALGNVGLALVSQGRTDEALARFERQAELARKVGDRRSEAAAAGNIGIVYQQQNRLGDAHRQCERGLVLLREIGDRRGESSNALQVGVTSFIEGRLDAARGHFEGCLSLSREIGDRRTEGLALANLGEVLSSLGRLGEARARVGEGLAIAAEVGDRRAAGYMLGGDADVAWNQGRTDDAEARLSEAMSIFDDVGDRAGQAMVRASLGALLARTGDTVAARGMLDAARDAAIAAGHPSAEALSLVHLATLPGGDVSAAEAALARLAPLLDARTRMDARHALFRTTGQREHLDEAKRLLDELLALNPPECRDAMLANVRLHREIAEAAKR